MSEIPKDDGYYVKDRKRLYWLASIVGLCLLTFFIYQKSIILFGEYRYTIATISGTYSDSKTVGIYYTFTVDSIDYRHSCTSNDCKGLVNGDKYLVKYYPYDLDISILLPDRQISDEVKAPLMGWDKIPADIFKVKVGQVK